jgi:predicted nucleic acid-binding protein
MIIKDAMVVIHLAKITLLEKSCDYFKKVIIPKKVYEEITFCREKHTEIRIVKELIEKKKISIKEIKDKKLLKKLNEFSLQEGEAEVVALYWQERADYLATDDDNVRKKSVILNIKIIGTPVIILKLYKEKMIEKEKFVDSIIKLRKIGWFSNAIIDKVLMEGK